MSARRPPFLDWRYWVCLVVAIIGAHGLISSLGLGDSNWRFLIYAAFGVVAGWAHEQWADWREASR